VKLLTDFYEILLGVGCLN